MRLGPSLVFCLLIPAAAAAIPDLPPDPAQLRPVSDYVPEDLAHYTHPVSSELRELVDRYTADRHELLRFYSVSGSTLQRAKLRDFYRAWQQRLAAMPFETLGVEGRIDWVLLTNHLKHELLLLDREEARRQEMAKLLPFADALDALQERRRYLQPVDPQAAATALTQAKADMEGAQKALQLGLDRKDAAAALHVSRVVAYRTAAALGELRTSLNDWYKFYDGYDPAFDWWVRKPYAELNTAFDAYVKFLRERVVGIEPGKDEPIVGDPIGRAGLEVELANEMIAYQPEDLLAIANREFAWCENELRRASRDLGFGDNWKAAMEKVKQDHLPPGGQPLLVRKLALEAIDFVQQRNLVTLPPVATDFWTEKMMPPEQQKVAPFFLGGEDILIAFPTETMSDDEKLQSLRANNLHFARATVFHEMLPGHRLQFYYMDRYNPQRQIFMTPFWIEGWALWWEFQMWDHGFPQTPEDRLGMLFWRTHRCARIVFSLNFQLGKWTPEQCVDFLIDRVGHERASATGEVRRSFNGSYSPLYQAGYMLGALQLRALHGELVKPGGMTDRQFHDAILQGGPMPIELVRARLKGDKVSRDFGPSWKFAGPLGEKN